MPCNQSRGRAVWPLTDSPARAVGYPLSPSGSSTESTRAARHACGAWSSADRQRTPGPGRGDRQAAGVELAEILCIQEERQVGNDNCVRFQNLRLQIPESPLRAHFVKATVKVRQYPDGRHAIFYGKRCLGRYDEKGVPQEEKMAS